MSQHLTDEQFAELLSSGYNRDFASHVGTCKTCEDELERVRTAVLDFGTVSLREAQKRSAGMVQPSVRVKRSPLAPPAIWVTAAAGLVLGVGFGVHHFGVDRPETPVSTVAEVHASQNQKAIAEDNALLSAIDADLRWKVGAAVDTPAAVVAASRRVRSSTVVSE